VARTVRSALAAPAVARACRRRYGFTPNLGPNETMILWARRPNIGTHDSSGRLIEAPRRYNREFHDSYAVRDLVDPDLLSLGLPGNGPN
jgi:hypothetical protein